MNFFRHQEQARRNTAWLVFLFAMATAAVVLTVNLLFILVIHVVTHDKPTADTVSAWSIYTTEHWFIVSATTVAVILICSLFRQLSLSHGSDVANSLGATLLDPGTRNADERRLLNVVEEMAIASGMPVPDVYVMEDSGINAFAAGYQPSDAVVGVTRGAIEQLNREQLQGVIAHEFSHIFNGDMRMNMRLTGILYGIVFIGEIGQMVLRHTRYRSSNDRGNGGAIVVFGLALGLMVIGYTGEFFGRLIKAAVSRQREFLADASAVQFTRNASGISGALKIIGYGAGTRVSAPTAMEMSHFFFGPVARFRATMFATHPPLDERIERIEPGWNGHYLAPQQAPVRFRKDHDAVAGFAPAELPPMEFSSDSATGTTPVQPLQDIRVSELDMALTNAHSARALIFALLIAESSEETARRQQDQVERICGQTVFRETLRLLNELRRQPYRRLQLVEQCMPALRRLSQTQYNELNKALVAVVQVDARIELYEWCLYRLVLQYLGGHFGTRAPVRTRYKNAHAIADEIAIVMSYVAAAGSNDDKQIELAYRAGIASGGFLLRDRHPDHHSARSMKPLNVALRAIAESAPLVRETVLRGLIACARQDHHITDDERDLLIVIAAILETPIATFGSEVSQLFS